MRRGIGQESERGAEVGSDVRGKVGILAVTVRPDLDVLRGRRERRPTKPEPRRQKRRQLIGERELSETNVVAFLRIIEQCPILDGGVGRRGVRAIRTEQRQELVARVLAEPIRPVAIRYDRATLGREERRPTGRPSTGSTADMRSRMWEGVAPGTASCRCGSTSSSSG